MWCGKLSKNYFFNFVKKSERVFFTVKKLSVKHFILLENCWQKTSSIRDRKMIKHHVYNVNFFLGDPFRLFDFWPFFCKNTNAKSQLFLNSINFYFWLFLLFKYWNNRNIFNKKIYLRKYFFNFFKNRNSEDLMFQWFLFLV